MIARSRRLFELMLEEDDEEANELDVQIETAVNRGDVPALKQAMHDLRELLFFVEGRA